MISLFETVRSLMPIELRSDLELVSIEVVDKILRIFIGQGADKFITIEFDSEVEQATLKNFRCYDLTTEQVAALSVFMQNLEKSL